MDNRFLAIFASKAGRGHSPVTLLSIAIDNRKRCSLGEICTVETDIIKHETLCRDLSGWPCYSRRPITIESHSSPLARRYCLMRRPSSMKPYLRYSAIAAELCVNTSRQSLWSP